MPETNWLARIAVGSALLAVILLAVQAQSIFVAGPWEERDAGIPYALAAMLGFSLVAYLADRWLGRANEAIDCPTAPHKIACTGSCPSATGTSGDRTRSPPARGRRNCIHHHGPHRAGRSARGARVARLHCHSRSGQSLDQLSQAITKISDKILLVCVLNLPCIINLKRLLDTLKKWGCPDDIDIIANRFHRNADISLKEAEESLNKKIVWSIPNAYKVSMSATNQGKPLYTIAQGTEIWKKYRELAHTFSVNNNGKMNSGNTRKTERGASPLASFFGQR